MILNLLNKRTVLILLAVSFFLFLQETGAKAVERENKILVSNMEELKLAMRGLKAGDTVLIESGIYTSGFGKSNLQGTKDNPIIIEGKNPGDPPVFMGKGEAVKLSNAAYVKLKNLSFVGFAGNGINIDDGGKVETPSHHIII